MKPRSIHSVLVLIIFIFISLSLAACSSPVRFVTLEELSQEQTETCRPVMDESLLATLTPLPDNTSPIQTKFDLWTADSAQLRGANIWQARVIPEVDGSTFKGSGVVGPPFSQEDFDLLASLGANYVVISAPGLFSEEPPYEVDLDMQRNLDLMLEMIEQADMFATIAFRTGPGKAEWSLCCLGEPYYEGYFNDQIWSDAQAQAAWAEMWRYTAERYNDNRIVVGYKLMVEPNAADVLYGSSSPNEFMRDHAGSLSDWNSFYPSIVAAIREVDPDTPILVGADGYSSVAWLSTLTPAKAENLVYVAHQYMPYSNYTHQPDPARNEYPSQFDVDGNEKQEAFNKDYLSNLLQPVRDYAARHEVPIAIDEFGVKRWVPGATGYLLDLIEIFENAGWNYAIWEWSSGYEPYALAIDDFNYQLGTDPDNKTLLVDNPILSVLHAYWSRNSIRPSNAPW